MHFMAPPYYIGITGSSFSASSAGHSSFFGILFYLISFYDQEREYEFEDDFKLKMVVEKYLSRY